MKHPISELADPIKSLVQVRRPPNRELGIRRGTKQRSELADVEVFDGMRFLGQTSGDSYVARNG